MNYSSGHKGAFLNDYLQRYEEEIIFQLCDDVLFPKNQLFLKFSLRTRNVLYLI